MAIDFADTGHLRFSRRQFGTLLGAGYVSALISCQAADTPPTPAIEAILRDFFESEPLPGGLSAAAVKGETLIWSGGFGYANIDAKVAMTPNHIQSIASVSKTVTATAVMQLWEAGAFKLDDDINEYLSLNIRNPRFPNIPITFRQLLAHRSSIMDNEAYDNSYTCGDPSVSLKDWIQGYFSSNYDSDEIFHKWSPGTLNPPESPRSYSNVGYGILGYLVERITGEFFSDYCQDKIFKPLQMNHTGWRLSEINQDKHVKLYSELPENGDELYLADSGFNRDQSSGDVYPHCLYSFPNYPDGLVRTSVNDFSRFLRAYMSGGVLEGTRILKKATIDMMLSDQHFGRGLCWDGGSGVWGHDGGDPGVATYFGFTPEENLGIIVFFNAGQFSDKTNEMVLALYEAARQAP